LNAALQKTACLEPGANIDCAPQRCFGTLFLGRFLPKLGGTRKGAASFFVRAGRNAWVCTRRHTHEDAPHV
jgi:hypothetical protein